MTVPEVAAHLRVSERTVWRLLAAGHLSRLRVGRAVRIPEAAVQMYVTRALAMTTEGPR